MAITTSIARHFAVRLIVMAIVMLVLGLWGVYDYAIAIPAQQRVFDRYEAMSLTQRALQPDLGGEELSQAVADALIAIQREIDSLLDMHVARAGVERDAVQGQGRNDLLLALADETAEIPPELTQRPGFQQSEQIVASLRETNELDWLKALLTFEQALRQPRGLDGGLNPFQRDVYQVTEQQMSQIATDEAPTPPSTFDRAVQWVFISCLLCVPYLLWLHIATVRRVYRLDDDGALHTPEGTWSKDEIADIDMSRWMAKSWAHVVHTDGSRIKLDDYKHRGMHLIVGALAHRFYPEEWTKEAKVVKDEDDAGDAEVDALLEDQEVVDEVLDGEERV